MLVLVSVPFEQPNGTLYQVLPGTYTAVETSDPANSQEDILAFTINADGNGYTISSIPRVTWWQATKGMFEMAAVAVATYFLGPPAGAALADGLGVGEMAPEIGSAIVAGATAAAFQGGYSLAFGTPFSLTDVVASAVTGGINAAGDLPNFLSDLSDSLGLGDLAGSVGDLVSDVVDPDTVLGGLAETTLGTAIQTFSTSFVSKFLSGEPIASAALSSLESTAEAGLMDSAFFQDAMSYLDVSNLLSNTPLDTSFTEDALSLVSKLISGDLTDSVFGQEAMSFLVNSATNLLEGKPVFQGALSELSNIVSDGLGDMPFGQEAAGLVNQLLMNGVSSNFANSVLSYLSTTAADALANSDFVQNGMSFLSQTLGDGLSGSSLVQDGLSYLEDTVVNGFTGSTFAQGVSSFLQQIGADGLDSLNSTITGEVGTFLQDAAQAGKDFVNSTLGSDAGAFLQQAAQNGVDYLNSGFADGATAFLQQAIPEIKSLPDALQTSLGSVLQEAAQAGTNFANSALGGDVGSFLQQAAQNGSSFLNSGFVADTASFLQQALPELSSLPNALQTGLGSFLQDAAQAGIDFATSTLGGDAGVFLQQAAHDGVDFLKSSFVGDAASFLQQTIPDINSLPNTLQNELGAALQDAAQAGVDFANSTFATDMGTFLQQAGTEGAAFLNSPFMNEAASFMQRVSQAGLSLANSKFAVDGQTLLNSVLSDNLGSLPFGQDVGAFLDQLVSNNGLATSSFAASAASFLQQAVAAGQTSSDFTQGAFTLLNGVDSANLTNMVQSLKLAPNNTISAQFQASSSSDADAIINFVNQLPSYTNSPMTVTVFLANGVSSSGVTANPPPGVTLIIIGQGGITTLVGHWNVTTTAVNTSAVSSPNAQTVKLNATVSVTSNLSAQVNEGTVTFTVKNGQTIIGTPVQGTVSGGTASASFSLPAGLALGSYTLTVSYSDSHGNITDSGNTNATLTVGTVPAITSGKSAAFTVGQGGSFTVTATGSPTPTLSLSGALPSGGVFKDNGNGTATLVGTPAAGTQGIYHFTIAAQNGVGSDATQSFTLTVRPALVPPPTPPAPPIVPPLLALFNQFLGELETVNANGTTITDNLFGFPLVETYDSSGNLVSVTLLGFNITFLFG